MSPGAAPAIRASVVGLSEAYERHGSTAIAETARGFMSAFPDMVVKMDQVSQDGNHVRWTSTGTNSGPGGTGQSVRISGYVVQVTQCERHFGTADEQAADGSAVGVVAECGYRKEDQLLEFTEMAHV